MKAWATAWGNETAPTLAAFSTSVTLLWLLGFRRPPKIGRTNTPSSNPFHLHLFLSLIVHFYQPHFYSIFTLSTTSCFSSSKFLQLTAGIAMQASPLLSYRPNQFLSQIRCMSLDLQRGKVSNRPQKCNQSPCSPWK